MVPIPDDDDEKSIKSQSEVLLMAGDPLAVAFEETNIGEGWAKKPSTDDDDDDVDDGDVDENDIVDNLSGSRTGEICPPAPTPLEALTPDQTNVIGFSEGTKCILKCILSVLYCFICILYCFTLRKLYLYLEL